MYVHHKEFSYNCPLTAVRNIVIREVAVQIGNTNDVPNLTVVTNMGAFRNLYK